MHRTVKMERMFSFGDFKHLKVFDDIVEIPDALNQRLVEEIEYLQLVTIEIAFKRYANLAKKANTLKEEDVLKFLEEERDRTFTEIKSILKDNKEN